MKTQPGVYPFIEEDKIIAYVDNTNEYDIVILVDESEKYIQKFFIELPFNELINSTKYMRDLGLPSL